MDSQSANERLVTAKLLSETIRRNQNSFTLKNLYIKLFASIIFLPVCNFAPLDVKGQLHEDVLLPCTNIYKDEFDYNLLVVHWQRPENDVVVHTFYYGSSQPEYQSVQYRGRTEMFYELLPFGNLSLLLRNLSKSDAGIYTCHSVLKETSGITIQYVNLTLEACEEWSFCSSKHRNDGSVLHDLILQGPCMSSVPSHRSAEHRFPLFETMDKKSDVLSKYDEMKKELKEGMITEKGFDAKVKQLLENCCLSTSAQNSKEAALIFEEMQNCLQGKYKNVKKKQYPLNDDAKPSFLKVKIIPMQWTSKTKTKAGRFTKIVLDEEPSRLFMNREDGYEQLLQKGKDLYWPNHSNEEYEFNLCNLDGTRWIKTDFEMEHKTLGEIKDVWKRNFYIGMKKKDISANAVPSFPFGACSSAANVDSFSNLPFKLNLDSNPQSLEKQLHIDHHASKKLKTLDIPGVSFTMKDCEFNFSELEKDASSKNEDQTRKKLDTLYYPRLPYVPKEHIRIDDTCVLGRGAFGTVYKGVYQGTVAAVKKIPCADNISPDIMHEILVNMRLSHPNIVRLMAAAKTENAILLASEYIHGGSLDRILHSENAPTKLSEEEKLYIGLEIALAVEYIHSQNILHQDIKPANVIIDQKTKKAFLTDWGMANIRDTVILKVGSRSYSQKIGPIGGTAMYMAPECVIHYELPSMKTDVWSLGATLLELFSNQAPWNTKNARELCVAMTSQIPPHATAFVDSRILTIIQSCFAYNADDRPTPSDLIGQIKCLEGVNLQSHYGYSW